MSSIMKIVVILLFILFFFAMSSIALYQYGPSSLQGSEILYNIHKISGITIFITVLWHIFINRKWLKTAFKGGKKWKD